MQKPGAQVTQPVSLSDASARPHSLANSVNECMNTGPTSTVIIGHFSQNENVDPHPAGGLVEGDALLHHLDKQPEKYKSESLKIILMFII